MYSDTNKQRSRLCPVKQNLESLGEVSEVKKFKQTLHGEVISFIRPLLLKLD